jgi:hypothetical protein
MDPEFLILTKPDGTQVIVNIAAIQLVEASGQGSAIRLASGGVEVTESLEDMWSWLAPTDEDEDDEE